MVCLISYFTSVVIVEQNNLLNNSLLLFLVYLYKCENSIIYNEYNLCV